MHLQGAVFVFQKDVDTGRSLIKIKIKGLVAMIDCEVKEGRVDDDSYPAALLHKSSPWPSTVAWPKFGQRGPTEPYLLAASSTYF